MTEKFIKVNGKIPLIKPPDHYIVGCDVSSHENDFSVCQVFKISEGRPGESHLIENIRIKGNDKKTMDRFNERVTELSKYYNDAEIYRT